MHAGGVGKTASPVGIAAWLILGYQFRNSNFSPSSTKTRALAGRPPAAEDIVRPWASSLASNMGSPIGDCNWCLWVSCLAAERRKVGMIPGMIQEGRVEEMNWTYLIVGYVCDFLCLFLHAGFEILSLFV